MKIVKYETEAEAQTIIAEKVAAGMTLIEVSNITEGNFLGFAENSSEIPSTDTPKTTVELLQDENTEIKLALAELAEIVGGAANG
jgi:hypothetical protein